MNVRLFLQLLQSARDHLTIAINDVQRGDTASALEHVEQVGEEMQSAASTLRDEGGQS